MRHLYTAVLYLLVPWVLLRLLWRGRRAPAYRRRWRERFGFFPTTVDTDTIWVHAVSVGEAIASFPLVRRISERYPDYPVVLTTTTPTGSERVTQQLAGQVHHGYAPYDLPGAVKRFLFRTRPRVVVVMETEIWPNLYAACHARDIPVIIANARLSERSAGGYRRLAALTRDTLSHVTRVAAQSDADAGRLQALGARPEHIEVTGNLKFDITLPASLTEEAAALRRDWGTHRPVWIAASTHEGEDEQVLSAFAEIRRHSPNLLLVLVPRHPERFDRVAELCNRQGLQLVRRTAHRPCTPGTDVFLGDTMGELRLLYRGADIAFVGGSLVPTGGHNPLEPAAMQLPVIFGPHMFNFAEITGLLLEAGGAVQVDGAGQLAATVTGFLKDPARRTEIGERAIAVVEANRGALDRTMAVIEGVLETTGDRGQGTGKSADADYPD